LAGVKKYHGMYSDSACVEVKSSRVRSSIRMEPPSRPQNATQSRIQCSGGMVQDQPGRRIRLGPARSAFSGQSTTRHATRRGTRAVRSTAPEAAHPARRPATATGRRTRAPLHDQPRFLNLRTPQAERAQSITESARWIPDDPRVDHPGLLDEPQVSALNAARKTQIDARISPMGSGTRLIFPIGGRSHHRARARELHKG
jgi:hypothetical protein